jgi:hypothetical protein
MGPQIFFKPIILKIDQILFEDTILQEIHNGVVDRALFLVSCGRVFKSQWWYFLGFSYIRRTEITMKGMNTLLSTNNLFIFLRTTNKQFFFTQPTNN